jgi:hypothetical protein
VSPQPERAQLQRTTMANRQLMRTLSQAQSSLTVNASWLAVA